MGLLTDLTRRVRNEAPPLPPLMNSSGFGVTPQGNYLNYARAYSTNEIVASVIDLRATSAAEPHIIGRRWRRERAQVRNERKYQEAKGLAPALVNALLVRNGFVEEVQGHPLVQLLNNPNPFMSRGQLWSTVSLHLDVAGNAYLLVARGVLGQPAELWPMRPDRVRVETDAKGQVVSYAYTVGKEKVSYPAADVLHFKTLNPLNDYYGMSPLQQIMGIVDIDSYMGGFLRKFFENGGTGPGSILTVKQKMSQDAKDEVRARFRRQFGPSGFHEMLILDAAESSYQQLGLNRGLRDALPKELFAETSARIASRYGVPGSIVGLLIGYETSSYANQRQAWQVFWDITMAPRLSDWDDVLNLKLVPMFTGISEVLFDLSDIKALQEDVDKIQDRHRKNLQAGIEFWEEARDGAALDPNGVGTLLIPSNTMPVRVTAGGIEMPEPPKQLNAPSGIVEGEIGCPICSSRLPVSRVEGSALVYCRHCKNEVNVGDAIIDVRPTVKEIEYDERGRMVRVKESVA